MLLENVGPRTLQTLAMIAEVIHGTPTRFADPARFSFALGGKDRHPFPVPLKTYDESIAVLRRSLDAAKVGDTEKIDGMKRLERFVRGVSKRGTRRRPTSTRWWRTNTRFHRPSMAEAYSTNCPEKHVPPSFPCLATKSARRWQT